MIYKTFEILDITIYSYRFIASNIVGCSNLCLIRKGLIKWYHSEQVPPYTTMYYDVDLNSVEFVTDNAKYNEGYFYSKRFLDHHKKAIEESEVLISQAVNNAEYIRCRYKDGKIIEPKYKTLDKNGNEFIGTWDECYKCDMLRLKGSNELLIEEVDL